MRAIMDGVATEAQIAAFLTALKMKGEEPDELGGFVRVMREKSTAIHVLDPEAVDMCGTGGDGRGTFNISTTASFVVAGAGVTVAKHGNRAVSSTCGSADVLKALGVNIDLPKERVEACINEVGIGFMFAPLFHPAMKYAAKPRTELGFKTCFNLLGPMTNPAGVKRQLVGAFHIEAARKMAAVFSGFDVKKVFVVSSNDGLDEISLADTTTVFEVEGAAIKKWAVTPEEFGLSGTDDGQLAGGNAETNAAVTLRVLRKEAGSARNVTLANAAFGLLASGKARTIAEGIFLAGESLDSGRALAKLDELRAFSNR